MDVDLAQLAKQFGTVTHDGTEYTLAREADFSNRLFAGGYQDAQQGEAYTVEFTCPALDSDGNRYEVTWQFDGISKGQEPEPDGYPFDDDHITSVIAQWLPAHMGRQSATLFGPAASG